MKKLSYLFAVAASAACLCACTDVTDVLPAEQIPADATYFFLAYGYYHQQESASFMHYLAKIRKEIPDMYATMGTGDTILMTDTYFNEALRAIKEDVSTGKINLNKYL